MWAGLGTSNTYKQFRCMCKKAGVGKWRMWLISSKYLFLSSLQSTFTLLSCFLPTYVIPRRHKTGQEGDYDYNMTIWTVSSKCCIDVHLKKSVGKSINAKTKQFCYQVSIMVQKILKMGVKLRPEVFLLGIPDK